MRKVPKFLVADHEGDKAVILRSVDYKRTLGFIKETFPSARRAARIILSTQLDGEDDLVEVTEEVWSCMVVNLMLIHVELDYSRWEWISVYTQWGKSDYEVNLATETVEDLKRKVEANEGIPSLGMRLWMWHPDFKIEAHNGYKLIYYETCKGNAFLALDEQASVERSRRAHTSS